MKDRTDGNTRTAPRDVDRILEAAVYLYTEGRRATKEVARHLGLTGPQVTAIKMLEGFGDLSLSALSEHMSAHNSTITGVVDRMVKGGLVERVRSTEDRRVVLIRLTPKGREIARSVPVTSMQVFAAALASLSDDEKASLRRILRKLSDRVREEVARTERQLRDTA
ncbi:MAG: MarR family winged helix-turn-helix transcriptional regulator [Myxococcota bacterium]